MKNVMQKSIGGDDGGYRLAEGLGFFSIGLGLLEITMGKKLARALGLRGQEWILPTYGVREIANGGLILASDDPTPWIWLRVAGDFLDIGTLAYGYSRAKAEDDGNFAKALVALAGATALDVLCVMKLSRR